jgi:endonuclease/exonuclease/phosphatase family metal-dependent hydrolase
MNLQPTRREALLALLASCGGVVDPRRVWPQELIPIPSVHPELRVLFFNTHLLPAIAQGIAGHRGQDDYRTAAIAAQLHRYDLIGLCEVFESHRRREIVRIVGENSYQAFHAIEPPKVWGRHLIGSGLLLLSRYPVEGEPHFVTYHSASRIITSGVRADGLAAKGAIHARLRLGHEPGMLADCFLTHLESVSSKARAAQIEELAGFIAAHSSPERPLILMGDLNVEADFAFAPAPGETEYRYLTKTLRYGDSDLVDLWPAQQSGRGGTSDALAREDCRRIDYIFLSPPHPRNRVGWQPLAVRVEPFLDAKVKQGSLSDHAGVECRLALRSHP